MDTILFNGRGNSMVRVFLNNDNNNILQVNIQVKPLWGNPEFHLYDYVKTQQFALLYSVVPNCHSRVPTYVI